MTARGQKMLVQHLVDPESVEVLARIGLDEECIPSQDLRKVVRFALDYFHASGQTQAPSEEAILDRYGDLLEDESISFDADPEDTIHYAIDDLKHTYVYQQASRFTKTFAADMSGAEVEDRIQVIGDAADELVSLRMRLESRESRADMRDAMGERMIAYRRRAEDPDSIRGLRIGISEIDEYCRGIHASELAILAAGPKTGKSLALARIALRNWQAGGSPVLVTLENSIEMTLDRMACMATGVEMRKWNHGTCEDHEIERVEQWIESLAEAENPLHVIQPPPGSRGAASLVREAQLLGADSLLIDQLTFVEAEDERQARYLQIRQMLHDMKTMISQGQRIPCLVAHQINREGVKHAEKVGMLSMSDMAEGSEVERTGDWVFGLFRSEAEREADLMKWQTLASRREDNKNFLLQWNVNTNFVAYRCEIDSEGSPVASTGMARR